MKNLIFFTDSISSSYQSELDKNLFASSRHMAIKVDNSDVKSYYGIKDNHILARISFVIQNKVAYSPRFAPYAGLEISQFLSPSEVIAFINYFESNLLVDGIEGIEIRNTPISINNKDNEDTESSLIECGYEIKMSEPHAILKSWDFEENLDSNYQRRLRHAKDLIFGEETDAIEVHKFLKHCRDLKGQKLSMSKEDFVEHFKVLQPGMRLFSLRDGTNIVAAISVFIVNQELAYDYAHAHLRELDSISPVIRLISESLNVLKNEGYRYLDLGSSYVDGNLNDALLNFKRNLGADLIAKNTWVKKIE